MANLEEFKDVLDELNLMSFQQKAGGLSASIVSEEGTEFSYKTIVITARLDKDLDKEADTPGVRAMLQKRYVRALHQTVIDTVRSVVPKEATTIFWRESPYARQPSENVYEIRMSLTTDKGLLPNKYIEENEDVAELKS